MSQLEDAFADLYECTATEAPLLCPDGGELYELSANATCPGWWLEANPDSFCENPEFGEVCCAGNECCRIPTQLWIWVGVVGIVLEAIAHVMCLKFAWCPLHEWHKQQYGECFGKDSDGDAVEADPVAAAAEGTTGDAPEEPTKEENPPDIELQGKE